MYTSTNTQNYIIDGMYKFFCFGIRIFIIISHIKCTAAFSSSHQNHFLFKALFKFFFKVVIR